MLPKTLRELMLNDNAFSGFTDFRALPRALYWLAVEKTNLEGTIPQMENLEVCIERSNVTSIGNKLSQFDVSQRSDEEMMNNM
eukprot:CAMPEP_0201509794 /NCGR_PEP_ID=MMETSP0161_2-20130828/2743_1 /ASSEMBLY_ACC=CAM_ASM_000251 /TAXON_ID=180227 /ORGANISM="Neoparamoeba aestuarina, Strain SoJaBio B1-5/56/2" /LENGTH=82 /DNA_ID=CAMNT_0047904851 /DNA_START=135 /DNA_END=380 /DNA_ORIENTATION=+